MEGRTRIASSSPSTRNAGLGSPDRCRHPVPSARRPRGRSRVLLERYRDSIGLRTVHDIVARAALDERGVEIGDGERLLDAVDRDGHRRGRIGRAEHDDAVIRRRAQHVQHTALDLGGEVAALFELLNTGERDRAGCDGGCGHVFLRDGRVRVEAITNSSGSPRFPREFFEYIPRPREHRRPRTTHAPFPVCGAHQWAERLREVVDYISGERFDVVRCTTCGLGATLPVPPAERLADYYPTR